MMSRKILIAVAALAIGAALVYVNLRYRKSTGTAINVETIQQRDLDAIVSVSGKIRPRLSVNVSADTMGRVTNLAVNEGDRVKRGQFLLQVDPKSLRTRVQSGEAGLRASRSTLEQMRLSVETARDNLQLSRDNLRRQRELWSQQLTTREALDRAENEVKVRESDLKEREQQVKTQQMRLDQESATLESARYDLSKVTIESPIDGIVTRRNIEEGETVVVGTMNNAGTVLLTIADMSVVEAEVEVDETDIPAVSLGQTAKISIDALADRIFTGRVTEIGNSPIQATGTSTTGARAATNFKVVVTLDDQIPDVRPGFTCTADITTARRTNVVAVPIQAMITRELVLDSQGNMVRGPKSSARSRGSGVEPGAAAAELNPGQTRKEVEGVFVFRDNTAEFVSVKSGIAGDKYFEVLSGLKAGDRVIVGPYNSVRDMNDGDPVKLEKPGVTSRQ